MIGCMPEWLTPNLQNKKVNSCITQVYITASRHHIENTSQPCFTWTIGHTSQGHTHHHSIACLKTGAQHLPKQILQVLASASSFNFLYPFISLRSSSTCLHFQSHLPVTSIVLSIFPSTTCFKTQFLCRMWPIKLAFLCFIVCWIFPFLLVSK
jgi:hypothetical protein